MDWEQRKLGEISESMEYGLNASATEFDGFNKYVRITDIDETTNKFLENNITSPNIDLSSAQNYVLQEGDLLFARTGASVGKSYLYDSGDGKVYYAGFLIRARLKKEYNRHFIFYNTLTTRYKNFIKITSQRSGQPGVNSSEYSNYVLWTPELKEQEHVGNLLQTLNCTLALHLRKVELLQQLKKGFLQKMFPSGKEKIPQIRFANYEGDWEQRKLGEISEKVMVKNTLKVFTETFTNSAEFGIISQVDFFDKQISNNINIQNYYVVSPNDFVYNPRISNRAPVGPIKRNKLGRTGVMSPLYYVFKFRELNSSFAEHYFNSYHWHKFMYQNGDSGARADRFAIKDSVFNKMPIPYPAIKEQEKIGVLFGLLENTLELHQSELEKLEKIKNSFLQKMFI